MTAYMMVGEVLKPQGVRGEVKVKCYNAYPDDFMDWETLYLKKGETYEPITSACSRVTDSFAYLTLGDSASMNDAERQRGFQLYIDRAHANELDEGEVYVADLLGCTAVDEKGNEIGVLKDVLQYGTVDTYVFKTKKGDMMAPALLKVFPTVDVENKRILVDSERLAEVAVFED